MTALMLLTLLIRPAVAEGGGSNILKGVDLDHLERLAAEWGVPGATEVAGRVLAGEAVVDGNALQATLRRLVEGIRGNLIWALRALAVPVLASMLARMLLSGQDGALPLLCRLSCAWVLAEPCARALRATGDALARAVRLADTLSPALAAALTLTGSGALSAALSPAGTLCIDLIENALRDLGLPLCAIAAAVNVAGGLSDRFRLDRLFSLLRRGTAWGIGLTLSAFTGLMALEGRLASVQDAAALRAARQMLRGTVPIIGGQVSDSAGALAAGAAVARSAVGATGMALAVLAGAGTILRLAACCLSMKLACAALEPMADPGLLRIASGFGDVAAMLLALCAGGMMLAALLCGACLGLFGG